MNKSPKTIFRRPSRTGRSPSRDETLEVLSNQRRRFVVHYLKRNGGRATVSELTDHVAGWENDKPSEAVTHRERKRVANALRQFHLPKMAEHGFLEYDAQRGTATLTETVSRTNFYIDSLTDDDIPWGLYYLGFASLSAVCLLGILAGVYPFSLVSPALFSQFFVTALLASSVGHCYDNYYRMRLCARPSPPETETDE
jgi:hypothetical protein